MTVEGLNLIRCNTCGATAAMPASAIPGDFAQPADEVVRNWAHAARWSTDDDGNDRCPAHSEA